MLDLLLLPDPIWVPQTGPQTEAWLTDADELFYGGQAGGGKTDLEIGLALTAHQRSVIFRREYTQFRGEEGIFQRTANIIGRRGRFHGRTNSWVLNDGRSLEFGAVERLTDVGKWRGRPHDLKEFDELPEFLEAQYLFLIGWLRTTDAKQRTRIVGSGNPPTDAEGEWVIRRWGPWLDRQHAFPALPAEIRWFAQIDDKDQIVEDGTPFEHKGETIQPRSRTFIPASLDQNKYISPTYRAVLQSMPEPLRSQLLYGDFAAGMTDNPWQVIPTAWVELAMRRWTDEQERRARLGLPSVPDGPQTCVGVDVARGGKDKTVLSKRKNAWYAPLERHAGKDTPDGSEGARLVLAALQGGGYANVDVIGVGASVYDLSRLQQANVRAINFSESAPSRDRTGLLHFVNMRAYAYWALREALDPVKGDGLMLPVDSELKADLCSARWMLRVNGIQVEEKADIAKRIGRSPDAGDAVVLSSLVGSKLPMGWLTAAQA